MMLMMVVCGGADDDFIPTRMARIRGIFDGPHIFIHSPDGITRFPPRFPSSSFYKTTCVVRAAVATTTPFQIHFIFFTNIIIIIKTFNPVYGDIGISSSLSKI